MSGYVHGYDEREARRLADQARTLVDLLHVDSVFEPGVTILEAGCGVGAQTVTLARLNPTATITAIDVSADSLGLAAQRCRAAGITNVTFELGDIFNLRYADASFDHVFVCFVLEHLPAPVAALKSLRRLVKPTGTITVIEGDHGSTFFHPDSDAAHTAIGCQVALQAAAGGNANIGRELYPLLVGAGLTDVTVSPRHVYVDGSRPHWIEGFTRNTFTAMIEGVRQTALQAKLTDPVTFDRGIADLYRTAQPDGVFSYMFFKATARPETITAR
ncbi:MAG: class I SAM-dependent methyltransferase [Acidimicrobiales bacterium]